MKHFFAFLFTTVLSVTFLSGCMVDKYKTSIPVDSSQYMLDEPWVDFLEGSISAQVKKAGEVNIASYIDIPAFEQTSTTAKVSKQCLLTMDFRLNDDKSAWLIEATESIAANVPKEEISNCITIYMKTLRSEVVMQQDRWNNQVVRLQSWEKQ